MRISYKILISFDVVLCKLGSDEGQEVNTIFQKYMNKKTKDRK